MAFDPATNQIHNDEADKVARAAEQIRNSWTGLLMVGIEMRTSELKSAYGLRLCAGGICGNIYQVNANTEPLNMEPRDACLRMLLQRPSH